MHVRSDAIPIIRRGIPVLGAPCFETASHQSAGLPQIPFQEEHNRVLLSPYLNDLKQAVDSGQEPLSYELAGPRRQLYFDPATTRAAIVTCGGLCPGLNDVIRGLVLTLHYAYGVSEVLGIRYGYRGLVEGLAEPPLPLLPEQIERVSNDGGTCLGTSRGNQDPVAMVDFLIKRSINILFTIGGDGTQRGALAVSAEAERRGYPLAVVGLPKTIDNDIGLVEKTFGFDTAVAVAAEALRGAHVEAQSEQNGVVIVKLMGRESGFLAVQAALASGDVNFILIPEVPFALEGPHGFFESLRERLVRRGHALVVIAEGVAETLLGQQAANLPSDASGNRKLPDVGLYLRDRLSQFFAASDFPARIKYLDPSYVVRSLRANPADSIFCQNLAHHAVHAAMSGRTRLIVATCSGVYCHIPLEAAVLERKLVDPNGSLWRSALQVTGQGDMSGEVTSRQE